MSSSELLFSKLLCREVRTKISNVVFYLLLFRKKTNDIVIYVLEKYVCEL